MFKEVFIAKIRVISQRSFAAARSQILLADGTDPCHHIGLLTGIGAVFKVVQNTFHIKWGRLHVTLRLQFLVG